MFTRVFALGLFILVTGLADSQTFAAAPADQPPALNSDKDKASFVYGQQLGQAFERFGVELDLAVLEKSAREELSGKSPTAPAVEEKSASEKFMAYIQKKSGAPSAGVSGAPVLSPETRQRVSAMYGRNLAGSIDTLADDLNLDIFFAAYAAAARGKSFKVNLNDIAPAAKSYLESNKDNMLVRLCAKNKKIGAAFLVENKNRDGVVTTASGLQYKILYAGKGPKPAPPAHVAAHFKAFFVNGMLFHDSHEKGAPAVFALDGVIDGWMEALKLMPEGSVWELYVPSDLAYGDRGSPGIPPGTTIVYQLELIKASVAPTGVPPKSEAPSQPASPAATGVPAGTLPR